MQVSSTLYTLFSKLQSSLSCHARRRMVSDSKRLHIVYRGRLEAFLTWTTTLVFCPVTTPMLGIRGDTGQTLKTDVHDFTLSIQTISLAYVRLGLEVETSVVKTSVMKVSTRECYS